MVQTLWQSDLLDASFRGVPFQVAGISDKGEKSLAIYEYPYRAGAEVEDLGRKARRIPVKALFWGRGYLSGLQALVKAFEERGKGELVHPVFGAVTVSIADWDIEQDAERTDYAAVSFECVETALDNQFFCATSARATAENAGLRLVSGLAGALQASQLAICGALAECAALPVLAQSAVMEHLGAVLDVYDQGRQITRAVLSYVAYPMAFVADLAAVQGVALSAVGGAVGNCRQFAALSQSLPRLPMAPGLLPGNYATGAGGYSTSWVSGAWASQAARAEALLALPLRKGQAPFVAPLPGSAQTMAGAVAAHAMIAQAQLLGEQAQGLLLAQLEPQPALTPQEVEMITGNARSRMQDCMDYARAAYPAKAVYAVCEGMRECAQAVQELGAAALNARPPLTRMVAQYACNFHLLAHRLYGDYARAAELKRLNPQVRNPNFIAKGQELLVYSE